MEFGTWMNKTSNEYFREKLKTQYNLNDYNVEEGVFRYSDFV